MFATGKSIREAKKYEIAEKERQKGLEIVHLLRMEAGRQQENRRICDVLKQHGVTLSPEAAGAIFEGSHSSEEMGRVKENRRVKYLMERYGVQLPVEVAKDLFGYG